MADPHGAHPTEHAHPGPAQYVKVAVILAIITSIEVAIVYIFNQPEMAVALDGRPQRPERRPAERLP